MTLDRTLTLYLCLIVILDVVIAVPEKISANRRITDRFRVGNKECTNPKTSRRNLCSCPALFERDGLCLCINSAANVWNSSSESPFTTVTLGNFGIEKVLIQGSNWDRGDISSTADNSKAFLFNPLDYSACSYMWKKTWASFPNVERDEELLWLNKSYVSSKSHVFRKIYDNPLHVKYENPVMVLNGIMHGYVSQCRINFSFSDLNTSCTPGMPCLPFKVSGKWFELEHRRTPSVSKILSMSTTSSIWTTPFISITTSKLSTMASVLTIASMLTMRLSSTTASKSRTPSMLTMTLLLTSALMSTANMSTNVSTSTPTISLNHLATNVTTPTPTSLLSHSSTNVSTPTPTSSLNHSSTIVTTPAPTSSINHSATNVTTPTPTSSLNHSSTNVTTPTPTSSLNHSATNTSKQMLTTSSNSTTQLTMSAPSSSTTTSIMSTMTSGLIIASTSTTESKPMTQSGLTISPMSTESLMPTTQSHSTMSSISVTPPVSPTFSNETKSSNDDETIIIISSVSAGAVLLIMIVVIFCCLRRRRHVERQGSREKSHFISGSFKRSASTYEGPQAYTNDLSDGSTSTFKAPSDSMLAMNEIQLTEVEPEMPSATEKTVDETGELPNDDNEGIIANESIPIPENPEDIEPDVPTANEKSIPVDEDNYAVPDIGDVKVDNVVDDTLYATPDATTKKELDDQNDPNVNRMLVNGSAYTIPDKSSMKMKHLNNDSPSNATKEDVEANGTTEESLQEPQYANVADIM